MTENFLVGIMVPLVLVAFYFLGHLGVRFVYGKTKAKEKLEEKQYLPIFVGVLLFFLIAGASFPMLLISSIIEGSASANELPTFIIPICLWFAGVAALILWRNHEHKKK